MLLAPAPRGAARAVPRTTLASPRDLVAKLPRERVAALVDAGLGEQFDPRRDGRLMKEWVVIAGADPPWVDVAREAHDFAGGATGKRR